MALLIVSGPSNAGPGEREQMLATATKHFADKEVDRSQVVRIDVPGKGAGSEGEGALRAELEPMIPLLQSGSLFGGSVGLELVDAQNLHKGEVETLVELLDSAPLDGIEVVLVATGVVAKPLTALAKHRGKVVSVRKTWERQAEKWLSDEVRRRGFTWERDATEAMLQRFGSDTAGMGQALDQLEEVEGKITARLILDRFKNRPDEPLWHITDAIGRGDKAEALRRLADFLTHGHPLVYLAALESDLKRRTLAAAAPDEETFRHWVGGGSDRVLARVWNNRTRVRESSLRRAQEALVRADRVLKTQPEDVHRVTLERLTVALCMWYR
ncbi:MAG: DNA polymerase III subunit delta [Acidimicrobiia bacterium]